MKTFNLQTLSCSAQDMLSPSISHVNAACRKDFVSFVRKAFHVLAPSATFQMNWHICAIAHALEQVRLGENKRLIISVPPRSLKSLMCSVAFPAFVLGHDPSKRLIVAATVPISRSSMGMTSERLLIPRSIAPFFLGCAFL